MPRFSPVAHTLHYWPLTVTASRRRWDGVQLLISGYDMPSPSPYILAVGVTGAAIGGLERHATVVIAPTIADARDRLRDRTCDLMILGMALAKEGCVVNWIRSVRAVWPFLPIVLSQAGQALPEAAEIRLRQAGVIIGAPSTKEQFLAWCAQWLGRSSQVRDRHNPNSYSGAGAYAPHGLDGT